MIGQKSLWEVAGSVPVNTRDKIEGGREVTRPVDLETIPLYVRAGAVIPMGPVKQYAAEKVEGPLDLWVHPGTDGAFSWYEGDGKSFDFRQGEFIRVNIAWSDRQRRLSLRLASGAKMLGGMSLCSNDATRNVDRNSLCAPWSAREVAFWETSTRVSKLSTVGPIRCSSPRTPFGANVRVGDDPLGARANGGHATSADRAFPDQVKLNRSTSGWRDSTRSIRTLPFGGQTSISIAG